MRRSAVLLTAVILALPAHMAWAQEPRQMTQEFFDKTKAGKINEAFDGLFHGSGIPETKPQAVDVLKRQTTSGLPLYGNVLRSELIYEESFGTSIVRLVYVLVQERAPTVWQFYFFKPRDRWILGNVTFNDQFQFLHKTK
jgi:hypothetical protein